MKLKDLKTLSPKQLRTLGKLADALPALATEIDFLRFARHGLRSLRVFNMSLAKRPRRSLANKKKKGAGITLNGLYYTSADLK